MGRVPEYGEENYRGSEEVEGVFHPQSMLEATIPVIETLHNQAVVSGNCDSPIEEMLGAFILTVFREEGAPLKLCRVADLRTIGSSLVLVPQYAWHFYRSDWAILRPAFEETALLVECDGQEFHSSPAHIEHDRKKDAAALDYGHITMRFPGRLIHKDPRGCARKVFNAWAGGNAA